MNGTQRQMPEREAGPTQEEGVRHEYLSTATTTTPSRYLGRGDTGFETQTIFRNVPLRDDKGALVSRLEELRSRVAGVRLI